MKKSALEIDCYENIEQSIKYADYIDRRLGLVRHGNWCGHSPDSPRFFDTPEAHKARPKILTWASDAWRRFYILPDSYFKELRLQRVSSRQQRSESREAVASIAQVLLHYTELASLRVGVPHVTDGFRSLTIEFLAERAGVGVKRAQRAVAVLKQAGYLMMIERFDTKEGEGGEIKFIGLAAVKCLTPSFFKACKINLQWLSAQRRLARKRLNKRRSTYIRDLQESFAPVVDISHYVGQANQKARFDALKTILKSADDKAVKQRERERERVRSLMRQREPEE